MSSNKPQQRAAAPRCKECDEEMVVTLRVPLSYAPGFEDVFYECPHCRTEVKLTSIPV